MSYLTVEDTFQFLTKIPQGNLVEFGVFSGNTMNRLIKGAEAANQPFEKVFGFDSFEGLPKETDGVWQNPEWPEGAFNVCKDFNLQTIGEAIDFVKNRVERKDIRLIPGFFEWSLSSYAEELKDSASYLHIDVDIYRSTCEVLEFLFSNRVAKPLSLFRYDDWISTPEYKGGNSLAHLELSRKYKINFNRIDTNVFQLINYA